MTKIFIDENTYIERRIFTSVHGVRKINYEGKKILIHPIENRLISDDLALAIEKFIMFAVVKEFIPPRPPFNKYLKMISPHKEELKTCFPELFESFEKKYKNFL